MIAHRTTKLRPWEYMVWLETIPCTSQPAPGTRYPTEGWTPIKMHTKKTSIDGEPWMLVTLLMRRVKKD